MKRKVLASFILLVLLFTNYVFAYSREGGDTLKSKASILNESQIDIKYTARTQKILNSKIRIKDSSGNNISKVFPGNNTYADTNSGNVYFKIDLQPNATYNNKITFELDDAIKYNNKIYNIKIDLNSIKTENNTSAPMFGFKIGQLAEGTSNVLDTSDNALFDPLIYLDPKDGKAEADIDYYILDDNGDAVNINGILELTDIDLGQGIAIEGFTVNQNNTFVRNEISNDIKVVTENGESYIYTTNNEDITEPYSCVAYLLMENKNKVDLTFTWDGQTAGTNIKIQRGYMIITEVENGTIDDNIYGMQYGDVNKVINYSPNDANIQYLKSIKVDGTEVPITDTIKDSYTFDRITKDYTIQVEYANKCKFTFDSQGGSPDNVIKYVIPGDKVTKIADPTKDGYTFDDWYTEPNGTTKYDFENPVNQDTTVYAKWIKNPDPTASYKVEHYLEDENGTERYNNKNYRLDSSLTETKQGIVGQTGTGNPKSITGYTAKESSQSGTIESDNSLVLKFHYDKNQYTIVFDPNGGSPKPDDQTKKYGETVDKPSNPSYDGHEFQYWYDPIEGVTKPYDFTKPVTSDKTLIAKWEEVIPEDVYHNINYIIDGQPDNSAGNPTKYKEGSTTPLTINNPTKTGYTFSGWFENQNLSGNAINQLDVSNKTTDITLYGKWTKNKAEKANYTVNHYLEDENGTVSYNNKKYKLDKSDTKEAATDSTVTENAQSYEGYEAQKATLSGKVTEDGSLVLDFYYNKKQYKVTFDTKGGNPVPDPQTKKYGEKVDKPTEPTKDGYKFLYWYEVVNGKKVIYDFNNTVKGDKELIAEWEEIKIVPDEPKKEIPAKEDPTTSEKQVLPKTGVIEKTLIATFAIAIIGLIFAIRYRKLKDIK